jgi:murein L,D-transpeptidase YcbB/YkuD
MKMHWKKRKVKWTVSRTLAFPVLILLFISCNKTLSPTDSATNKEENTSAFQKQEFVNQPLFIDTLLQNLISRVAFLPINDVYYEASIKEQTRKFYAANHIQTKWLGRHAPLDLFFTLTNTINNAEQYGLCADDYDINDLEEKIKRLYAEIPIDSSALINMDLQITGTFFLFSSHLALGKVQKAGHGSRIWLRENPRQMDLISTLARIDQPEKLRDEIDKLQPAHDQYAKLQRALDQYRYLERIAPSVASTISVNEKIKPNDKHVAVPLIRDRLSYTDLKPDTLMRDSLRYDEALVSAVKWFQLRHGLEPDGIIGAATVKFLNQSFKDKAEVIKLNMERLRWAPETYGDNYIAVNIPEYKLRVFENKKQVMDMKVIVGAPETPTPVFTDTLRHVVFSPAWNVPTSIIKNEIIPRLQLDSSYYSSKNYLFYKGGVPIDPVAEIWRDQIINPYSLNVIQLPGPDNSLGRVKFVMPNHMNIYLHDTPGQRLFKRYSRALSHGCIRLDEPAELAKFLLKDQKGWDEDAINKAMNSDQSATLSLKKSYRVQLEYYTAWVDENGQVNFREDIYGHDKFQLSLMKKKEILKKETLFSSLSGAGY